MAATRMHRGLVGDSASAIAAVCLAGYVRTQPADASIGAAAIPTSTTSIDLPVAIALTTTPVARVEATVVRTAPTPTSLPTPVPSAAIGGALKDGTYTR